jgi:putative transposase
MAQQHRFHVHDSYTYASWLNRVERWFGIISQWAIRSCSFCSVKELITQHVAVHNKTQAPFNSTAMANLIPRRL